MALHREGIIHGNLKTTNILISDTGSHTIIYVTDYDDYPGTNMDRKTGNMSYATRLVQPPEYLLNK